MRRGSKEKKDIKKDIKPSRLVSRPIAESNGLIVKEVIRVS